MLGVLGGTVENSEIFSSESMSPGPPKYDYCDGTESLNTTNLQSRRG
jgi:hypothetical protein